MKSLPLLLTFPVLLPLCTLQAASPLDRADGRLMLQDSGRKAAFRVVKDEVHRSRADGGQQTIPLRGMGRVRDVVREAKALQATTGDPVDLIAYEEGKPQTEYNKRLITKRVLVTLAEGVDPAMIMEATGAEAYNPLVFSPGNFQFFYSEVDKALDVAELLRSVDGVLAAEVLLAKKTEVAKIPTDPFFRFTTASAPGAPATQTPNNSHISDNTVYERNADLTPDLTPPWRFMDKGAVKPYQWYLNNTGEQIQHPGFSNWILLDPPGPEIPITGTDVDNTFSTVDPHPFETGDAVTFGRNMRGGEGIVDDEVTRYFISTVPSPTTFTVSTSARPGSPVNFKANITQGTIRRIAANPQRGWTRTIDGDPTIYPLGEDLGDQFVDINVTPAWGMIGDDEKPFADDIGYLGRDVTVGVIDQGVNLKHPEFNPALIDGTHDRNYLETRTPAQRGDPTPPTRAENHGTACAGLIFARHDNNLGMAGIAPLSKMLAIRIIGGFTTPVDIASAMVEGAEIDISDPQNPEAPTNGTVFYDIGSNSWGTPVYGSGMSDEDQLFKDSLKYGITAGRKRKGVVYVFASGNQGDFHDNSNYNYTANSPYTLTVGGVTDLGRRVSYSNIGASVAVVAPTKGDELPPRIFHDGSGNPVTNLASTTERAVALKGLFPRYPYRTVKTEDIPRNKRRSTQGILTLDNQISATDAITRYNPNFDGTSAATPLVSGVAALVLEAGAKTGKSLGWRDVHEILMRSAYPVDFTSPMDDPTALNGKRGFGEWVRGPLGNYMSHIYGYGCVDATKAVRMAEVWTPMPEMQVREIIGPSSGQRIRDDSALTPQLLFIQPPPAGMRLEKVQIRVRIKHDRRGDLGITLISPPVGQSGLPIESELYLPHREDYGKNIGVYSDTPPDPQAPPVILKEADFWTFTTVRNWGARYGVDGVPTGTFQLKIWDNTNMPANTNPKPENPVYVPIANPATSTNPAIDNIKVVYYGSFGTPQNDPPEFSTDGFVATLNQPYNTLVIRTESVRAAGDLPVEEYFFRFVGPASGATAEPHPNFPGPPLIVDPKTGRLGYTVPNEPLSPDRPTIAGTWIVEIGARTIFGTSYKRVNFVVREPINYTNWRLLNFTTLERNTPSIGGDQGDPDQDGVPNVLEFAMGTNPKAAQVPEVPTYTVEGNQIVVRYQRDTNATNAFIQVETSDDLQSWIDPPELPTSVQDGSLILYEFRMPIGEGKRFVRLKANAT